MVLERKVKKLIIDSGAFVKLVPLWEYGEEFYCVPDVIREIRDKQTKQFIDALPVQLQFKEPSPASIKFINEFTKKTGDFASLSLVDVKILALVYELEVEAKGDSSHLRTEPLQQRTEQIASVKPPLSGISNNIEGFYTSKKGRRKETATDNECDHIAADLEALKMNLEIEKKKINSDLVFVKENYENISLQKNEVETTSNEHRKTEKDSPESGVQNDYFSDSGDNADDDDDDDHDDDDDYYSCESENNANVDDSYESEDNANVDDSYESEDNANVDDSYESEDNADDDGWITPSNIKSIKERKEYSDEVLPEDVQVVCITCDYAMQNTLKHIGLPVMGVDGKLIKSVRTFILRCYACFKTTNKMDKIFCHHCGNKTLKKVAVTLNPDGSQKIWISTKKPINIRGTKFSLPRPKGGKHAINPLLVADQREAQQRASRLSRTKNDPLHEDYAARAGMSPFVTRDVYSRSAQLGIKTGKKQHRGVFYWEQTNPNVPRKKGTRRKKR